MDMHRNSFPSRIHLLRLFVFTLLLVALAGFFVLEVKADGGGVIPSDTPEPTSTMTPITLELESEPAIDAPTLVILPEATLDSTEEAFMAKLQEAAPLPANPTPESAASGGVSGMSRFLIGGLVVGVVAVIFLVYVRMRKTRGE
jgi:hypothetical protein